MIVSLAAINSRLRQGFAALAPAIAPDRDVILATTLTDPQAQAFRELPAFDQSHLLSVFRRLRASGESDRDVLVAALLHDLGKVDGNSRVRLIHRMARVMLVGPLSPLLDILARRPARRWRMGFVLVVHHPEIGAARAAALGCSARTCFFIDHHEDEVPPENDALRRLIAADHAC